MITDTEARRIAEQWHGGGGTALYALSSTGAIDTARADHDGAKELSDTKKSQRPGYGYPHAQYVCDMNEINTLRDYIETNGPRGPIDGWSTLTW